MAPGGPREPAYRHSDERMASHSLSPADEQVYNSKALGYLCAILFHPSSIVAQHVRAQWTRYSPGDATTRAKLEELLMAVFDAPAKLEISETYIQVLDHPALRIPRAAFAQFPGMAQLMRGLTHFFRTSRTSLAAQCTCYADYKHNAILHRTINRGNIACELVRYLLATTPDDMYYTLRNEIHAASTELWTMFWNRGHLPDENWGNDQAAMEAVDAIHEMTKPHSPIIRSASPETVRARLSSSADAAMQAVQFATPLSASEPSSNSSVFYVSHRGASQFAFGSGLFGTPP